MKLVSFNIILVCLTVTVKSQKYQEESFSFPPQLQTPNSILFSSDSSVYLPPESQTSIPYYTLNNINKLPYQYLSPTGTKAPSFYPTPFPMIMSSTSKSSIEDDDDDDDRNDQHRRLINIKQTPYVNVNNTTASRQLFEKNDFERRNPSFSNGEKNFEVKSHNFMSGTNPPIQNFIKPAARRMIITSEFQKVDSDMDQVKSASVKNSQYVHAPGNFISSTTEPAIPILRLSNEMDLDGSFSYEALGADQTHYVQHSRMENMGTDKEEQVVEGSYSYVGDDGRTYTVHYVADSNGFRASGDHLPVPPPIPEIIQRSIQYNLAEEAKRPQHLKSSWENEEREYLGEETRRNVYHVPPPRSLFTGRTPEAFSLGHSQGSMPNSVKITSSSAPNKTNYEVNADQSKSKGNIMVSPISPQITFLASQGAHNPTIQSQPHSTKVIGMEKSPLPKLMNYEAEMKEHEQEANKALWRWQYGLNTETNDNSNKNSISRSSSDSDDIYINFSDMTPNQYKQLMQTQILGKNTVESNTLERSTEVQFSSPRYTENINPYDANNINRERIANMMTEKYQSYTSTEHSDLYAHESQNPKTNFNVYSDIISSYNFTPQNQIATQSYNVEMTSFEPSPINSINDMSTNYSTIHKNYNPYNNNYKDENNSFIHIAKTQTPSIKSTHDLLNNGEYLDVGTEEKNTIKPLLIKTEVDFRKYETTTTEAPIENIIKDNIFLRNLFKAPEKEIIDQKPVVENNNINYQKPSELIIDKVPKYIEFEQRPENDVKYFNSKPLDLGNVLNYVVMKNHFESVKTKPKNKSPNNYNQNSNIKDGNAVHYIPIKENNENREINKKDTDYRVLNSEQQQELHGLIKNYKVLQRRKNQEQKNQFSAEIPRHIKTFHTPGLPPLGRAGPSLKSYLPPTYL